MTETVQLEPSVCRVAYTRQEIERMLIEDAVRITGVTRETLCRVHIGEDGAHGFVLISTDRRPAK